MNYTPGAINFSTAFDSDGLYVDNRKLTTFRAIDRLAEHRQTLWENNVDDYIETLYNITRMHTTTFFKVAERFDKVLEPISKLEDRVQTLEDKIKCLTAMLDLETSLKTTSKNTTET